MTTGEVIPSDHPKAGVFIGNMLMRHPQAFEMALNEEMSSNRPVDERRIDNVELVRSLSQ